MSQESMQYNFISKFYKSFSGTDTLVFIMMPGSTPVVLGSISTISYSQYRTKQPVINLGRTNINGVTRGTRIYAGTMIFTLINQHWLNELSEHESLKWLTAYEELKTDELPLFDIMIVSANEYGSYVSMYIYGVDITDEGQVISIEDLFTENTLSFIARNLSTFKAGSISNPKNIFRSSPINNVRINNFYIGQNNPYKDLTKDILEDMNRYNESVINEQINKTKEQQASKEKVAQLKNFTRELQYRPFDMMVGDDVGRIQQKLRLWNFLDYLNFLYDKKTEDAVKQFQSFAGLPVTGVVDAKTYIALNSNEQTNDKINGIVINQSGTRVYSFPNIHASIVRTLPYNSVIEIHNKLSETPLKEIEASGHTFYQLEEGYVVIDDIYSYEYSNNEIAFPTINHYESGPYVTLLQELLTKIYGDFEFQSGTYDDNTITKIRELQTENNINSVLGVVNEETWRFLHSKTGDMINQVSNNKILVESINPQGIYNLRSLDLNTELFHNFNVNVSSKKETIVKATGIAYYSANRTSTIIKEYTTKPDSILTIDFSDFRNLFSYTMDKGFPEKIEYILYPIGGEASKWIINYKGV